MHQVATWKGDSLLCNLKAHCGNMENLWLKTVQQIVFLVVSEHSLVVENLRTSYIVWVIQLFGMFEIWKRKITKRQTKSTNTKCVSWMITTFNDEFVLPFFFPAPFLVLVAQASSTKDLLRICSSRREWAGGNDVWRRRQTLGRWLLSAAACERSRG